MKRRSRLRRLWSAIRAKSAGRAVSLRPLSDAAWTGLEPLESRTLLSVSIASVVLNNPVVNTAGSELTITATGITAGSPGAKVHRVTFYADTDSDTGTIDATSLDDLRLGSATVDASGTAVLKISSTRPAKFPVGSYLIVAVAEDSTGAAGFADTTITVNAVPPQIKHLAVSGKGGGLQAGGSRNTVRAAVTDPGGSVQSVTFYINSTPVGGVTSSSMAISGTPVLRGGEWVLSSFALPPGIAPGTTVELVAQATGAGGGTCTQVLNGVTVTAAPTPSILKVSVIGHHGQLQVGGDNNVLSALLSDPGATVQAVSFYINLTPSGTVNSNSLAITGNLIQLGDLWVLSGATVPTGVAAGSTVEVVAQATDASGNTYTQSLENVAVVAAPAPSITQVVVTTNGGELWTATSDNTLVATISDPGGTVQTVSFFVNTTPSGVVNSNSEPITGTLVPPWTGPGPVMPVTTASLAGLLLGGQGRDWMLEDATLPANVAPGTTVEVIAQATDASGNTYTQTLENVSVVAAPTPAVTQVGVVSNAGQLLATGDDNTLSAWVSDPAGVIQSVAFFVNTTPSGVVNSNSLPITGTLIPPWPLPIAMGTGTTTGPAVSPGGPIILGNGGSGDWVLEDATMPAGVAAGTTVEIIAQATDASGNTYTQTLENVSVVAAPAPAVTQVAVASNNGQLETPATDNSLNAWVSDPGGTVQSVQFYLNTTPTGVVNSNSQFLGNGTQSPLFPFPLPVAQTTGALMPIIPIGGLPPQGTSDWELSNFALPTGVAPGSTVEIVAQATDASGNTYTLALENVSVVAAPVPSITHAAVVSNAGRLVTGTGGNLLSATVSDPDDTIQTVQFFVNTTPSGTVNANSQAITGTLEHVEPVIGILPQPMGSNGGTGGTGVAASIGGSSSGSSGTTSLLFPGDNLSIWTLSDASLPSDIAAGSTVEIVVQATDASGNTYTLALENIQVIAPPTSGSTQPVTA